MGLLKRLGDWWWSHKERYVTVRRDRPLYLYTVTRIVGTDNGKPSVKETKVLGEDHEWHDGSGLEITEHDAETVNRLMVENPHHDSAMLHWRGEETVARYGLVSEIERERVGIAHYKIQVDKRGRSVDIQRTRSIDHTSSPTDDWVVGA